MLPLKANDTVATVAGGAINYEQTNNISMDYEMLRISSQIIDITYDFTNHTGTDITTKVAFPLPLSPISIGDTTLVFPSWDDLYQSYKLIDELKQSIKSTYYNPIDTLAHRVKGTPFTDFKRTVNNIEYSYEVIIRAIGTDGKDITAILVKNNIPLSATYVGGFMEGGLIENDPKLKQKLKKLKLIDKQGKILWQLKTNYIWNQTFPAKKTIRVTHSYTPHVGRYWMRGKFSASINDIKFDHRDIIQNKPEEKKLSEFCIKEADKLLILEMFNKDNAVLNKAAINGDEIIYPVQEIRYILSTGNNWKGPIKSFYLEIIPPTSTSIAVCCFDCSFKKTIKGTYVCEIENFSPRSELKVLFIDPKNS